jgi:hypothetical protein
MMNAGRQDGLALVVALMVTVLMSALASALSLIAASELMIAANFRRSQEALYAADAAVQLAAADLTTLVDWGPVLGGVAPGLFADGPPGGKRTLDDGTELDLTELQNLANCGQVESCTDLQLDMATAERPWGRNNPRWKLYLYGKFQDLLQTPAINCACYVVVLVADDPSENDADPISDGTRPDNPGAGLLVLRGEAFGPRGVRKSVSATVGRGVPGSIRTFSRREVR